jgi:hypothetical protein
MEAGKRNQFALVEPDQGGIDHVLGDMTIDAGRFWYGRPAISQRSVAVAAGSTACMRMPFCATGQAGRGWSNSLLLDAPPGNRSN